MYSAQCIFCRHFARPLQCFVAGLTFKWNCAVCGLRNRADLSEWGMVKLLESPLNIIIGLFDDDYLPSGRPIAETDILDHLREADKTNFLTDALTAR